MIAQLKSKVAVVIDTYDNISVKPIVRLLTFNEEGEGYRANGNYYYEKVIIENEGKENETTRTEEVIIRSFGPLYTPEEMNALHSALNLQYPPGATFDDKNKIQKMAGLKYIVASEQRWGLQVSDWE